MTEAELCAWFQTAAEAQGFVVYNEWADFDQLLVRPDGIQIGVEAKLRASVDVLDQAVKGSRFDYRNGPHHRAVLVTKSSPAFRNVAWALGVVVFDRSRYPEDPWPRHLMPSFFNVPTVEAFSWGDGVELPEVMPDVAAGKACVWGKPMRLTPWKLKAIKLCMRLREKGYVVSSDFKEFDVDPGRWQKRWLQADGKEGKSFRWVPREGVVLFDEQHPGVVAQLQEKAVLESPDGSGTTPPT